MRPLSRWLVPAVMLSFMLGLSAWADPPARVGRLSHLSGAVSFRGPASEEWLPATLNYPVTSGNSLKTEAGSRAEIQFGSSSLSAGATTALDIATLDDTVFDARLSRGAIILRVRHLEPGEVYAIRAPGGAISLLRPGRYRIDAYPQANSATLVVFRGEAQVAASGSTLTVPEGATAKIERGYTYTYDTGNAPPDEFDRWALAQEGFEDQSQSAQYVSPETTGYPDLDQYGYWQSATGYGPLWFPSDMAAGWAPYRFGHWAWIGPWGWTWIDDAPWGFAPFHFGRWVLFNSQWAWSPGIFVARPVFAPALVAFVGGTHFRIFLSSGGIPLVGWFPLAPGEVFIPAFDCSPLFVRQINAPVVKLVNVNVISIHANTANFVNRTIPGAVTVITQQAFVARRPVATSVVKVPLSIVTQVPVSRTTVAIVRPNGAPIAVADPPPARVSPPEKLAPVPPAARAAPWSVDRPAAKITPLVSSPAQRAVPGTPGSPAPAAGTGGRPAVPSVTAASRGHVRPLPQPVSRTPNDNVIALRAPAVMPERTAPPMPEQMGLRAPPREAVRPSSGPAVMPADRAPAFHPGRHIGQDSRWTPPAESFVTPTERPVHRGSPSAYFRQRREMGR